MLHALSVDYLDICEVNFDTGECEVYRSSGQMGVDWATCFQESYAAAMERYIFRCVVTQDQER